MTRLLFPQSAILDILERLLTTPFYCWKFAPFCERHSFLCIVAVCWWKNEAYTDWYYSILLLSVIINGVTFVTDDFIFAKMERTTKLLDKKVAKFADISKPFMIFSLSKCRILWNLLFLLFLPYLLLKIFTSEEKFLLLLPFLRNLRTSRSPSLPFLSIFSHRRKNSCYFWDFCEICRHLEALLDLFSF